MIKAASSPLAASITAAYAQQQAAQADYSTLTRPWDDEEATVATPEPEEPVAETPFRTSLRLSEDRQGWLFDRAWRRMGEVRKEMGMEPDGSLTPYGWMAIRERNQASYDNDYDWRTVLGGGANIFRKSNFSQGTSKKHVKYLSARIQDDLTGTTPFFAALGTNSDRSKLAQQVEEVVQDEVESSAVRAGIREGETIALIRNETVMKMSYAVDETAFYGPAKVLAANGEPLKTQKGLYVFEHDDFLPDPATKPVEQQIKAIFGQLAQGPNPQLEAQMAQLQNQLQAVLEKDPSFVTLANSPEGMVAVVTPAGIVPAAYQQFDDLLQSVVHFKGPKAEPIDYRCFLCPLRFPSVHAADINAHLFRESILEMKKRYAGIDVSEKYIRWANTVGNRKPNRKQGEQDEEPTAILEECNYAEVYIRCDADNDLRPEEIFLVLDLDNRKIVFYDYLQNVFPTTKRRPFEVIPGLERYPGRWYGVGVFTMLEDHEMHIDAEFNRANARASRSTSLLFRYRNACEEWQADSPVVFGSEDALNVNEGYDAINRPPIFKVNLAEENEKQLEQMEITEQHADALVGAISTKDASQSNMNQSKTATGIVSIQQAADSITKATEFFHEIAIKAILEQVVELVLGHLDTKKLILNPDATEIVTLNAEEIRTLQRDVRLVLTRSRSSQLLNTAEKAIEMGLKYRQLMQADPQGAQYLRPLFIRELKGLEYNDADAICPPVTDEMIKAHEQAMANNTAAPSERYNLQIKYDSLERGEQRQFLEQNRVTPATDAEMAKKDQQDVAKAAALKEATTPTPQPSQKALNAPTQRPQS